MVLDRPVDSEQFVIFIIVRTGKLRDPIADDDGLYHSKDEWDNEQHEVRHVEHPAVEEEPAEFIDQFA